MTSLYRIWQSTNNAYDTFDSAIVAANCPEDARAIHPRGIWGPREPAKRDGEDWLDTWAPFNDIQAECIGEATPDIKEGTVLCASFNAG